MKFNNMPAEFDPSFAHNFPLEIDGSSDQDLWDPSYLFEDCPTSPPVPPTDHFLADGNPVVVQPIPVLSHDVYNANPTLMPASDLTLIANQEGYSLTDQEWWNIYNAPTQPPMNHNLLGQGSTVQPLLLPPSVLSHDVYNANPTLMPASDLPLITNHQKDYSLTDQEWWHIYNVPTQPPTNHDDYLLAQGNTVQPLLLPPPPAQNSESMIPTPPPTLQREEYSMIDKEWCDFQFEGSIDPDDELECAFADVMERAASTIRKMYSMPESKEVVGLPPKLPPQASKSPELGQGKRKNHWTEEEHRLFLEGLKAYRYGEWKNIARDFVKTRTHIQIASHAQKFRQRSNGSGSGVDTTNRKRKSIHDITTADHIPNPNYRRRST